MFRLLHLDMAKLCSLSYLNQNQLQENFTQPEENTNMEAPYNSVLQKCKNCPELITGDYDAEAIITQYQENSNTLHLANNLEHNTESNNNDNNSQEQYLSIVFRGTESKTDIFTDLKLFQVFLELPTDYYEYENLPLVHQGFYQQFMSLKPQVENHIEKYIQHNQQNKIVFAGHSLGGALATISALYFSYRYPDLLISCITLGSPRVGDSLFVQLFNQRIPQSYRYVNDNDPVPCLPTSWRFAHVKGLQWLHEDEIKNEIMVWRFYRFCKNTVLDWFGYGYNPLQDHSCLEYIQDLHTIHKKFPC